VVGNDRVDGGNCYCRGSLVGKSNNRREDSRRPVADGGEAMHGYGVEVGRGIFDLETFGGRRGRSRGVL